MLRVFSLPDSIRCVSPPPFLFSAGLHIMGSSSRHPVELLTGLGATGVEVVIALLRGDAALPAHPLVPVLQCAVVSPDVLQLSLDLDIKLPAQSVSATEEETAAAWAALITPALVACLTRSSPRLPKLFNGPVTDFQMPRATNSVSM